MKTFDTLYKRTKTGAIQFHRIWVDTVDSAGNYFAVIFKEAGQLNTNNPILHKEEIHQGKNIGRANETTPLQQALLQAESDWRKKRDEGYKSFEDLGIGRVKEGVHTGLFTINNVPVVPAQSLEEVLNSTLPQFNSDANGNVKPMLATDWTKVKDIKFPCYIQPKLDGVRCLMLVEYDGDYADVTFLSRSGKEYTTLTHIEQDVLLYTDDLGLDSEGSFILDGEIYSDELTFQEITQAVKKQYPNSLKLKFRAYDVVNSDTQEKRLEALDQLIKAIASEHIVEVETRKIDEKSHVKLWHDRWVQEGYEGAMLRHLDGIYGQGQRSRDLLKVKEFDANEFRFYGWEFGQRQEDLIALCATASGSQFKAKMVGTREQKEELYRTYQGEGQLGVLTVKHFGWTEDGLPRFPIGITVRDYD